MPRKVVLIADPGIDTAFAVALALHDPDLDVVGLIPCAGNVSAHRACQNIHILIDQLDPPKWPRTAAALPVEYGTDGTALHGPDGLGGTNLPASERHQQQPADKVLAELVRDYPRELTVLCLGPATTLAAAGRSPATPARPASSTSTSTRWPPAGCSSPACTRSSSRWTSPAG